MTKKHDETDKRIEELTADLQRVRADFENYRKRMEAEKKQSEERGEMRTALKLLPVIDTIERATTHIPEDIVDHQWVQGVAGLVKQLDTTLAGMKLKRIKANKGTEFDPELHQAVQMEDDAEGDKEVVAEELQAGYKLGDTVIRAAMVKVTRQ